MNHKWAYFLRNEVKVPYYQYSRYNIIYIDVLYMNCSISFLFFSENLSQRSKKWQNSANEL